MRYEEIQVSVEIVITECRRYILRRPDFTNTRGDGYIGKCTVAVIDEDQGRVALYTTHVQIEVAIAIHVGEHRAAVPIIFRCRLSVL